MFPLAPNTPTNPTRLNASPHTPRGYGWFSEPVSPSIKVAGRASYMHFPTFDALIDPLNRLICAGEYEVTMDILFNGAYLDTNLMENSRMGNMISYLEDDSWRAILIGAAPAAFTRANFRHIIMELLEHATKTYHARIFHKVAKAVFTNPRSIAYMTCTQAGQLLRKRVVAEKYPAIDMTLQLIEKARRPDNGIDPLQWMAARYPRDIIHVFANGQNGHVIGQYIEEILIGSNVFDESYVISFLEEIGPYIDTDTMDRANIMVINKKW